MAVAKVRSLSEGTLIGLCFIQKYRFLTIAQFARAANFSLYHAADVLRGLERWGVVGSFGNTGLPGQGGKTPKVYFLKRKGFALLCSECPEFEEITAVFTEVHKETTWSAQMYHRLRTVDLMISAECAARFREHLRMVKTFLEYKLMRKQGRMQRETSDYVASEETSDNRLVPDAAFIMENVETRKRALFFVEMDMATERIITRLNKDPRATIRHKLQQYDRYLTSLRYTTTYAEYGDFRYFTLLFVTVTATRIASIKREIADLPEKLAGYYCFTTFDLAMGDFLGPIWQSRALGDANLYALVR